jgi:hypothetical protein
MVNCLREGARQRQPFLSLTLFPNIANRDQFLRKEGIGYALAIVMISLVTACSRATPIGLPYKQ